jgi:carboxyl-terminal processing protease
MENKNHVRILLPTVVVVSIIIGLYLGKYVLPRQVNNQLVIYPRSDKITNIINFISKEYVDKVDKTNLIEKTIPKVLEDLDPHSYYIPASEFQKVNEPLEGNFSGIGVQFNMLNDTLIVIKAISNGPSERVGIQSGDRFITVDGDTVAGVHLPSDSIVKKLKGPQGTQVTVGVHRTGVKDLIDFTIVRDQIPLYSVDASYMITNNIGYVKVNMFSRTTFEEFAEAVAKLLGRGMEKIIVDIRGNAGGLLPIAVKMVDQFLDEDQLIVYTQGNAQKREEYRASKGGLCSGLEVAILIDETSASASEILAGAIQDNDRGLLIGRRSYGKGLVQTQNMLSDGSALRLTIARYYTPSGRCIQKSYTHGTEEYYNELNERYIHGDYMEVDSNLFNDSLKYTTPGGRIVYGGGGIMPDIFVPWDTSAVTDYLISVRNHGLIYRFALEYTDMNRIKLGEFKTIDDFTAFLDKDNVMKKFISYAAKKGVKYNAKQIKISKKIIDTQLKAYIARNIFDNEGYYPIIQNIDNTLQVAIQRMNKGIGLTVE